MKPQRRAIASTSLRLLLLIGATALHYGCVLAPPLQPEPPEENKPPYLNDFQPSGRTSQISVPVKTLRAKIYDQNRQGALYVAWFGKKSGFIKAGPHYILPNSELYRGIFYQYEPAVHELSTCSNQLRNEDSETIWLYVSDSPLDFPTTDQVTQKEGGYLVTHSWDLTLLPDRCNSISQ